MEKKSKPGFSPWDECESNEDEKKLKIPTFQEVHNSIPAKCYEINTLYSSLFVVRDVICASLCFFLFNYLDKCFDNVILKIIMWTFYALIQGTILTGLWVIGHECGHGAFSQSRVVNYLVGYILHTVLLVPYASWQYSHAQHHKYCNNLIHGTSHVPGTEKGFRRHMQRFHDTIGEDGFALYMVFLHLVVGWQSYIFYGSTHGRSDYKGKRISPEQNVNHFNPINSAIFPPKMYYHVCFSTLGCLGVLAVVITVGMKVGFLFLLKQYIGPYFIVNGWLVLYTWLHHTHPNIPHYGEKEWSFLRGACSTIDRPYSPIIDHLHHHIGSTHVVHHINPKIPHYHALEATKCVKEVLGDLYRVDNTPIVEATMQAARECHFVGSLTGVQYYGSLSSSPK